MAQIAAIGEVMVELAPFPAIEANGRETFALSFAGDTYNTSVYMARLGVKTDYVTLLGDDVYSNHILQRMASESIGTDLIKQLPGRSPGLYIIHNTPDGEREFFYWRNEAPARELFASDAAADQLYQQLVHCRCVYLSGITLAIIGEKSREFLYRSLHKLRQQQVMVAFDSNYRPRLWRDRVEAQHAMRSMMQYTDIALLTLDDEQLLWGDASLDRCKQRYASVGLRELVIKRGPEDVIIITPTDDIRVPVPPVQGVIDTTGAGDGFNAGYLAGRLLNQSLQESANMGIRCAEIIIRHRGAIIEKAIFNRELGL